MKKSFLKLNLFIVLCLYALFSMPSFATLYEDAEDGDTQGNTPANVRGWFVYDNNPEGSVISNVYDSDKQSRVINLNGPGNTSNGYMLGDWYTTSSGTWNNTNEFNVHWCAKYSSNYVVYMRVYTDIDNGTGDGHQRYIYYTAVDSDGGLSSNKDYIHHGLGTYRANGEWHSINRNLQVDLDDYDIAGNNIYSTVAFLIRGTGRVDDIYLTREPMKPNIQFNKSSTVIYDPINKNTNPKRIPLSVLEYTLKANNIGFGEASSNSLVIKDHISPKFQVCVEDTGNCKKPYLASNTTHTLDISSIKYKIAGAWQTNPAADANGYNSSVTDIKIETTGVFPGYCGTERSFEIKFRVGVK